MSPPSRYEWTGEILGTGAYSTVREAKHKGTGEIYAVKQINKMAAHDLADDVRAQVFDEYDLLQRCRVDGKPHREPPHCYPLPARSKTTPRPAQRVRLVM
jgi:serine/threonine protein kinase